MGGSSFQDRGASIDAPLDGSDDPVEGGLWGVIIRNRLVSLWG